jgi:hypothetical protein
VSRVVRAAAGWAAQSLGALAAIGLLGWLPAGKLAGDAGRTAFAAGCAVALVGALLGAAPVLLALARGGAKRPHVTAGWAMALRSGATLAGAVVATLGTGVARTPFLAGVALAYGTLLVVETRWTVRWLAAGGAARESRTG